MNITDTARELIQNALNEYGAKNIRIYFAGMS
jgi:poly(3-hydroxybutyrate) depolymerase